MIWNKRIKDLREDHDLTQKQIAEILNITQRQVSYYENNQREIPISIIIKYCIFFNVTSDYILGLK